MFHGLSLSTQALSPLGRRSLSSSCLELDLQLQQQPRQQHHRPHHRPHHHHHHNHHSHAPPAKPQPQALYGEAGASAADNSKDNNSKDNNSKDSKRTKKAPNRILRSPVTYAYVRGISGLPTQRVPRHRLAPNPGSSNGYCRGPVAGTSPGLSRHAYNS